MQEDRKTEEQYRYRPMLMRLRHQLQALALPASVQVALYPDGAAKAEELAFAFGRCRAFVVDHDPGQLTDEQIACLGNIEDAFNATYVQKNENLWTQPALRTSAEWHEVRSLASEALTLFDWRLELPRNFGRAYDPNIAKPREFQGKRAGALSRPGPFSFF